LPLFTLDLFAVSADRVSETQVESVPSGRIASVKTRPTAALGRLIRNREEKVAAISTGATTPC